MSVRAQSRVSETLGDFLRSRLRIERTMRATWSARFSVIPGVLARKISFSRASSA